MDAIRKQLDVLMGANRNGDVREVNRKYYDRDVCRLFLAGLCPHDLFQLTKMDLGPCPKIHSLLLRKDYEEVKAKGSHNFDRELEDVIEKLILECQRKIQRALKRLKDDDARAAVAISVSEVTQTSEVAELSKQFREKMKEVDELDFEGKTDSKIRAMEVVEELRVNRADKQALLLLDAFNKDRASLPQPLQNPQVAPLPVLVPPDPRTQEMINEKLKKAEDLGEKGMIEEAQNAMEEAEALRKLSARREPAPDSSKYTAADVRITDQKLRMCDICGAFLSVYDSDRRLADHFGGKLHLGYIQIREKLAEMQSAVLLCTFSRKRKIRGGREIILKMIEGQKNKVKNVTKLYVTTEIVRGGKEEKVEKGEGTMIGQVETMTNIMTETVDMIGYAIENQTDLAVMTRGGREGHDHIQGIVLEVMTGTGAMTGTTGTRQIHSEILYGLSSGCYCYTLWKLEPWFCLLGIFKFKGRCPITIQ